MEDFASALESFEQEQAATEAALNEDALLTGRVLKITAQFVVVDIGYKSEGVVPLAELQDHEGNVTVQPGDEIAVMRGQGHTKRDTSTSRMRRRSACAPGTRLRSPTTIRLR